MQSSPPYWGPLHVRVEYCGRKKIRNQDEAYAMHSWGGLTMMTGFLTCFPPAHSPHGPHSPQTPLMGHKDVLHSCFHGQKENRFGSFSMKFHKNLCFIGGRPLMPRPKQAQTALGDVHMDLWNQYYLARKFIDTRFGMKSLEEWIRVFLKGSV